LQLSGYFFLHCSTNKKFKYPEKQMPRLWFTILSFFLLLLFNDAVAQNLSGVVNRYYKVIGINVTTSVVRVDNASYLASKQRGLLIQMKGADINQSTPASNSSWGNITSISNAGKFELVTVCGLNADSVIFEREIKNTYDVNGYVQLVIFPDLVSSVTIVDSVFAAPWDSTTGKGGVVFINVDDTVYLNDDIVAGGKGFRGGDYTNYASPYNCSAADFTSFAYNKPASGNSVGGKKGEGIASYIANFEYGKARLASGGGGGNNHNTGGAGGGNWGAGGIGGIRQRVTVLGCVGNNPGFGGVSVSSYYAGSPLRFFMGGGGGAGHANDDLGMPGGHGGGIVFIKCDVISGNNRTIYTNGNKSRRINALLPDSTASSSDGAGGGGAGGSIIIYANEVINNLSLQAKGADGGRSEQGGNTQCSGTGGGGGGGVVWFSTATTPVGVNVNTNGGIAGTRYNGNTGSYCDAATYPSGSTAGANGTTLFNFSFSILDTTLRCYDLLPAAIFTLFRASANGEFVKLNWQVSDPLYTASFFIEKSFDGRRFTVAEIINGTDIENYFANVVWENADCYYRIKALGKNGVRQYSKVAKVKGRIGFADVTIFPNPVTDKVNTVITVVKAQSALLSITDMSGKLLYKEKRNLVSGRQTVPFNKRLAKGMYQLKIAGKTFTIIKSFIRL
jgi:Secretion system C-terminal sorting domain